MLMGMSRLWLLVCLSQEISAWQLFKGSAVPQRTAVEGTGDVCGTVPISSLKRPEDFAVGTLNENARAQVPQCPVAAFTAENVQAGGHAGAFHVLQDGNVAKISYAFHRRWSMEYSEKRAHASGVEWGVYMEMWCLRRLLESPEHASGPMKDQLEKHPLKPFVTGGALAWAPQFYGICRLGTHQFFYMVIQNVLGHFKKPCQIDIKLGYMTAEPDYSWKSVRHTVGDLLTPTAAHAARLAGYRAWDPLNSEWYKMKSKLFSPMKSLSSAFDIFLNASPRPALDMLTSSKDTLLRMAAWWRDNGIGVLDAVGMSVLMAFECEQQGSPAHEPILKLIDFAHLYPHEDHRSWPDNGIDMGMLSVASELTRQMSRLHNTSSLQVQNETTKNVDTREKSMKCPRAGQEVTLTRADCLQYGRLRGRTFATWKQHRNGFLQEMTPGGICRACEALVPQQGSFLRHLRHQEWEVFRMD